MFSSPPENLRFLLVLDLLRGADVGVEEKVELLGAGLMDAALGAMP